MKAGVGRDIVQGQVVVGNLMGGVGVGYAAYALEGHLKEGLGGVRSGLGREGVRSYDKGVRSYGYL